MESSPPHPSSLDTSSSTSSAPPPPPLDRVSSVGWKPHREAWGGSPILSSPAEGQIVSVSVIALMCGAAGWVRAGQGGAGWVSQGEYPEVVAVLIQRVGLAGILCRLRLCKQVIVQTRPCA